MTELTQLIELVSKGERGATDSLIAVVYDELRQIAAQHLAHESSAHTLQATALVHEAFLRLFAGNTQPRFKGRGHFFSAASEAMRRILVDHARRKKSKKRGGDSARGGQVEDAIVMAGSPDEILCVHEALDRLAESHPQKAEVVKLRYFAGLTIHETAEALELSVPTANRYWAFAKAWLFDDLHGQPSD